MKRKVTTDDHHTVRQRVQASPLKLPTMAAFRQKLANVCVCEEKKSLALAYILLIFLGMAGAHHFYLRRWRYGVMYMLTLGLCGFGYAADFFRLPGLVELVNDDVFAADEELDKKCNLDAYILWFPCGIIGFHHFYLGNFHLGILYFLTFGVYGVGWMIDFFRIPSLVANSNVPPDMIEKSNSRTTAYLMAVSPLGILGAHHYYLGRWKWGLLYTCTGGVFIFGWLVDIVRVPSLVSRENKKLRGDNSRKIYVDDVYLIWLSFGLFGAHHYFLQRKQCFLLYLVTFGLFGFGWVLDLFRIPYFVRTKNSHADENNCIDTQVDAFAPTIYKTDTEQQEDNDEKRKRNLQCDLSFFLKRNDNAFSETCDHEQLGSDAIPSPILKQSHKPFKAVGKLGPKKSSRFLDTTCTTVESFTPHVDSDENVILRSENGRLCSAIRNCTSDINPNSQRAREIAEYSKNISKGKIDRSKLTEANTNVTIGRSSKRILHNSVTNPNRCSNVTETESLRTFCRHEDSNSTNYPNHISNENFIIFTSTPRDYIKGIDTNAKAYRNRNTVLQTPASSRAYSDTVKISLTDKRVNPNHVSSFSNESKLRGHYVHKFDTRNSRTSETKGTKDLHYKHSKGLSVSFATDDERPIDGAFPGESDIIDIQQEKVSSAMPRTRKRKKRSVRRTVRFENCGEIEQNLSNVDSDRDTTTPCQNSIAIVDTDRSRDHTNGRIDASYRKSYTKTRLNGVKACDTEISGIYSKTVNNSILNSKQTNICTSDTVVRGHRIKAKRNQYLYVNSPSDESNVSKADLDPDNIYHRHSEIHSKLEMHDDTKSFPQNVRINDIGLKNNYTYTTSVTGNRPAGGIAENVSSNDGPERSGAKNTNVINSRNLEKLANGAEAISNEGQGRKSRKRSRRSSRAIVNNSEPNLVTACDQQTSHCSRLSNSCVNGDYIERNFYSRTNISNDVVSSNCPLEVKYVLDHDNSIVRRSTKKGSRATEACVKNLEARLDQRDRNSLRKNMINASQLTNTVSSSAESSFHDNHHTNYSHQNPTTTPKYIRKMHSHNPAANSHISNGAVRNSTTAMIDQGRQELMNGIKAVTPTVQTPLSARELMQNLQWDSDDDIL